VCRLHLLIEKRHEIARMQAITNLEPRPAETDIRERPPLRPAVDPEREDALILPGELAGAGQDSAAIDPHRQIERIPVLERQLLGCALRRAVQRQRWLCRKAFGHAERR